MQWCLLRCWVNEHAWSQSSLSAHYYGELLLHVLRVFRAIPALLLVDSSSVLEVRFSSLESRIATAANTLSEAGFSPLIQVFLSRFYAREKLGTRVAVWLAMAPLG